MKLTLVFAIIALLASCASEPPPVAPQPPPEPPPEYLEPPQAEREEPPEPEEAPRTPVEALLPGGLRLVLEGEDPARRRGDFDGDGREDTAYLAVSGDTRELEALGLQQNLYGSRRQPIEALLLLRLASGEDLLISPGRFLLLSRFSALPVAPRGSVVYLRFEEREQQRHLLFAADPTFKTPQRYLFVTDTARGFHVRDVDGDGEQEILHIETALTGTGVEESYFTLYQFHGGELERRSRFPLVSRSNALFSEIRRLLLAGEDEPLLRRHTVGGGEIDAYFAAADGTPLSELSERAFVFAPEIRANPFNLAEEEPLVTTEILIISESREHIYEITLAIEVAPGGSPELKLLPTPEPGGASPSTN